MGREAIVPNVNWFMSVPVLEDGSAGVVIVSAFHGANFEEVFHCPNAMCWRSLIPQMHNPCNGYRPTAIKVTIS